MNSNYRFAVLIFCVHRTLECHFLYSSLIHHDLCNPISNTYEQLLKLHSLDQMPFMNAILLVKCHLHVTLVLVYANGNHGIQAACACILSEKVKCKFKCIF